jgi:Ca-activated chloride channel family protein
VRRGQLAGLLDQERANIFTQQLANIPPNAAVEVTIRFVETLRYEAGRYEFMFPMVVGPRYIPKDTDGSRITPPITVESKRAGHDISLDVNLDAGFTIGAIDSTTHEVQVEKHGAHTAAIHLKNQKEIPNKDFILRYGIAGAKINDAFLTYRKNNDGYFTFLLAPPERTAPAEVTPKELVFVIDTSGSMHGFPLEKAKETMLLAMDNLNPEDTFNLITFSGDTHILFPEPVPATPENLRHAKQFLVSRSGGGGTEMMKAIRAALASSGKNGKVRVVCFMTDGYVGDEPRIIEEVKQHPMARVFSFGIGSSVNRYLLDQMAEHGRGEVEYVNLQDDGSAAAKRFHERVRNPLLTDITIDWNGLPVSVVYPQRVPDLFSAKPLVLTGRYSAGANGQIRIRGKMAGRPFERVVAVTLPASAEQHYSLATLWARTKVASLTSRDMGNTNAATQKEITDLGLWYRILTPFTSFVAVEERTVTEGGRPKRIEVPVEMPEGVSYEHIAGAQQSIAMAPVVPFAGHTGGFMSRESRGAPLGADGRMHRQAPQTLPEPSPEADAKIAPQLAMAKGKVGIRIYLSDVSQAVLDQLAAAGFQLEARPGNGKLLAGTIDAEKLQALAKIAAVRHIAPR